MLTSNKLKESRCLATLEIVLEVLVCLCLYPVSTCAQDRIWTTESIAVGKVTSLAIDHNDSLHLAYVTPEQKIAYAFHPKSSKQWFTTVVGISSYSTNIFPDITVDSNDIPHLCYSTGTLRYVTVRDRKWISQEIDPGSGTISYHCSVAVGANGVPHVIWYHEFLPGGKEFTTLRHAELQNGEWLIRSIDGAIAGKWNSMVIDSEGRPHISYSAWARGGDLKYTELNGDNWSITTVDPNNGVYTGYSNSLVLGPDGSPHITYLNDENELKYASRSQNGRWVIETIDRISAGALPWDGSALALDRRGAPHVVYGDFGKLKHVFWDGSSWQIQTIIAGGLQQYVWPSIAVGSDDTLYISYSDPTDGHVKVAVGRLVRGSEDRANQIVQSSPEGSR